MNEMFSAIPVRTIMLSKTYNGARPDNRPIIDNATNVPLVIGEALVCRELETRCLCSLRDRSCSGVCLSTIAANVEMERMLN